MLKRFAHTLVLVILASYFVGDIAIAQTRRSKPRRTRSSSRSAGANKIQPLTPSQRDAVAALIEEGKRVEYKINYARSEFADSAMGMASCDAIKKFLPEGNIRAMSERVCQEYYDAGQVYGRVTNTGLRNRIEVLVARKDPSLDTLPLTIDRYGLQRVAPFQAVNIIFNMAVKDREFLEGMLYAAPIIPEPKEDTSVPDSVVTTQEPARVTIYNTAPTPNPETQTNPLVGNWALEVTSPDSQRFTFTLTVKQESGALNCVLEANGERKPCVATGNSFTLAVPNIPIEGQVYNMDFAGSAEADSIKGKLTFTNRSDLSVSLPLTGRRIR